MQVTTFAIDLAKSKFQVHGYTQRGEKVVVKTLTRKKLLAFFEAREERCRVVMEACATAHYWARELNALGYQAGLLPPQHVAALVMGNKNDPNDTDAIYEAAQRPNIRAVPVKSEQQQDIMALHRIRDRLIKQRTALTNQIRGLLGERGVVFNKGLAPLRRGIVQWLEEAQGPLCAMIAVLWEEWQDVDRRIANCDRQVTAIYRASPACGLIGEIEGIGTLTATAAVAKIGDATAFASGREFSAWVGLTPRERASGQYRRLGGITKHGDGYLRKLLVHGARAAVLAARNKTDARSRWIQALIARRGMNRAVVALANKNARIVWAMLRTGECYRRPEPLCA